MTAAQDADGGGDLVVAERHFAAALRAAASAGDPVVGVNTLAFWAIQHYSTGDPRGAVALVEEALRVAPRIGSARMTAMLHARACRAHAHAGDGRASDRHANLALNAYRSAGPIDEDPDCVYWFNLGELYQLLGSSALNLDDPRRALAHFESAGTARASEAYDGESFPRGFAIYLSRQAEARLGLGDVDGAVLAAEAAVEHMGCVTSARGTDTLGGLRSKLGTYATSSRPPADPPSAGAAHRGAQPRPRHMSWSSSRMSLTCIDGEPKGGSLHN
ncbi:hypothetical protein [Kitasatospora griseola]|uniref:hypothetical protein n=1 Tax=Kitasatospora griseola TaxID=2064 RepID=UPI0038148629